MFQTYTKHTHKVQIHTKHTKYTKFAKPTMFTKSTKYRKYTKCTQYTCIPTYKRTYMHTSTHAYMHTNIHAYIHIHTSIHTWIHAYMHKHTDIQTDTHTQTYIHAYIHAYSIEMIIGSGSLLEGPSNRIDALPLDPTPGSCDLGWWWIVGLPRKYDYSILNNRIYNKLNTSNLGKPINCASLGLQTP